MKVMHKRLLEMRDHVGYSRVEREIMGGVDHPFLVGLSFAFQTSSKLYLVMPYMAGGELFSHLNREGTLMEDAVRVYAAEMVLALEHLHSVGIVHRDLKVSRRRQRLPEGRFAPMLRWLRRECRRGAAPGRGHWARRRST